MKKIKFRAYNTNTKELVVINDLYWFEENFIRDDEDYGWDFQQYIGQQDKNGTDIYEGDVIRFYPDVRDFIDTTCVRKNLGHVWIYDTTYGVTVSFNHPYSEMSENFATIFKTYYSQLPVVQDMPLLKVEIVGNIFENPEIFDEKD